MFRIVAFPLGALAVLVTLEVVLRAMSVEHEGAGQRALHQLRLDRTWIYGLRPGAEVVLPVTGDVVYRINADGFRDRRYPLAADRPRLRIVVLGASITFGFGVDVDQTYVERLEVLLAARGRDCIDVLNFGVSRYNPYNQEAQLADLGLAYGPDLVLVEFGVAGLQDPAIHFDARTRLHLGMIPEGAYPNPSMHRRPSRLAGVLRLCRSLRTCSILDDALLGAKRPDRQAS